MISLHCRNGEDLAQPYAVCAISSGIIGQAHIHDFECPTLASAHQKMGSYIEA
jgi:hypothetical protein